MQKLFLIVVNLFIPLLIWGQDSVKLSISEADNIFLSQNLILLAEHYNVNKAEAMLIQAGLFENPTISFEQIAYNSATKRYFNTGSQYVIEIEQVICISGKRAKEKEIERHNIEIVKQEFEAVLRELKYALRVNMIDAAYTQKSIAILDKEIEHLDRLVKVYNEQYGKGNVSLIEKSRLEALLFTLKTEQLEYINMQNDIQKQLRLLLNLNRNVIVVPDLGEFEIDSNLLNVNNIQIVIENNPQLKIAEIQSKQNEAHLALQKRLRVPELAIKGIFDKAGGVSSNYFGVGVSVGLPFFNRNQGNLKAASAQLTQSKLYQEYKTNEVYAEMALKFDNLKLIYDFYMSIDKSLEKDFADLIEGVIDSFEKQTINMLEFIDYYETYKETCLKLFENETKLLIGAEEINRLVGNDYIKLWTK